MTELSPEQRTALAVPGDSGLLVKKVEPGSPAAAAGIKTGDVLTKFDKSDLKAGSDLTGAAPAEKGKQQSIELIRDKKPMTVQIASGMAIPDKATPDTATPDTATPDTQMPSGQNPPSSPPDTQNPPTGPGSDMTTPPSSPSGTQGP